MATTNRDSPEATSISPSVFGYIIRTVGPGYTLNGAVPWASGGRVFFGACKKRMRPQVKPGDYIMGISGSDAGHPRRVLLWMKVDKKMTFKEAYDRGKKDKVFRALRGTAIHVRPRDVQVHLAGDPNCYEHIPGAPHEDEWYSDARGTRDVFLTGAKGSWIAEANGPQVTETLIEFLKEGITWKGLATPENPLTENARGKHACVSGIAAHADNCRCSLVSSRQLDRLRAFRIIVLHLIDTAAHRIRVHRTRVERLQQLRDCRRVFHSSTLV